MEACNAICDMIEQPYIDIRLPSHPELYDPLGGLIMAGLYFVFGYTLGEIAKYIKKTRSTVEQKMWKALRWIRTKRALLDFFITELSPLKPLSI